jgi:hypothetical protein
MSKIIDLTELQRKKAYEFWVKTRLEYGYHLQTNKSEAIYDVLEMIDFIIEYNYRDFSFPNEAIDIRQQKLAELQEKEMDMMLSATSELNLVHTVCNSSLRTKIQSELKYNLSDEYFFDKDAFPESVTTKTVLFPEARHINLINCLNELKNKQ